MLCAALYPAARACPPPCAQTRTTRRYTHGMTRVTLPASGRSAATASLKRRDFFALIVERLRTILPPELAEFRHQANTMLLKIHYGNERVHFEVWPDGYRGFLEIGLHFEDGPASTAVYLAFFDARIVEIKHLLGGHRWSDGRPPGAMCLFLHRCRR